MTASVPRCITLHVGFALVLVALVGCAPDRPVAPRVVEPSFGKGGPTANPTVSSTTPAKAPRNITLNVTIAGSGFDPGSRAVWAIAGDTTYATTKVKTNATTYVSARQLTANISIAGDASVDLYDVQVVTLGGRKGIGIELFAVTDMVDLGPPYDSASAVAYDINGAGSAVGYTIDSLFHLGEPHATKWTPAGGAWITTDLRPQLGGNRRSSATGVNAAGDIVGSMSIPSGETHGFLLSAAGVVTDLGSLPGLTHSGAWDVNATGEVVGVRYKPGTGIPTEHPFYWSLATGMVALPTLGVLGDSTVTAEAQGINDSGTIVGYGWDPVISARRAVRWQRVSGAWTITRLPSTGASNARAINNRGDIVGDACVGPAPCQGHAVIWPAGGALVDIGTLGGSGSAAGGVNSTGSVVGWALTKLGHQRAFTWTLGGGMKDLGSLDGDKGSGLAFAVSEFGLVAGVANAPSVAASPGQNHAVLWRSP